MGRKEKGRKGKEMLGRGRKGNERYGKQRKEMLREAKEILGREGKRKGRARKS